MTCPVSHTYYVVDLNPSLHDSKAHVLAGHPGLTGMIHYEESPKEMLSILPHPCSKEVFGIWMNYI